MLTVILAAFMTAQAAPMTVTQQGRILDGLGEPVNGTLPVHILLWDQASGSNPAVWDYTWPSVNLEDGYYALTLGQAPSPALDTQTFSADGMWVEVTVDGQSQSGRQPLTSVPYAANAEVARMLHTQIHTTRGNFSYTHNGVDSAITSRAAPFTKAYDDTGMLVTWYDNWRCAGDAADCRIDVRFRRVGDSGPYQSCAAPVAFHIDIYQDTGPVETINTHTPATVVGYCTGLAGGVPFTAGQWEMLPYVVANPDPGTGEIYVGWNVTPVVMQFQEILP